MTNRVLLPRQAAVDRLMAIINGTTAPDPSRFGYMSPERAGHTLDLFKSVYSNPLDPDQLNSESLKKSVTVSTGLTYYDLRAPALNLFPTVTPLRNAIPRAQRQYPGDSAHWKAVNATIGSGQPYMGWVPEGRRSASMSYSVSNQTLSYMTLGEEDSLTEEARFAAEGFEDEDALVQLRLLLKMFVKEEAGILGGDNSLALGTVGTVATSASGTGGTLPAGTYGIACVALTQEGFLNSSLTGGVATALAITGNDGLSYTLNGGSSNKSAVASQIVTSGQTLFASVTPILGAFAYAWYTSAPAGSEKLEAITTINSVAFSAPLAGTHQALTAITADTSTNPNYAFNGLLPTAVINANAGNAYMKTMATGTSGTGTFLHASGSGGVVEIDDLLQSMWDSYRISPTVMYVNSQELRNITKAVLSNSSSPLLRYNVEADQAGMVEYKLTAAGVISFYFNPFTPDGGVKIPVKVHPNIAAGTIMLYAERLPPWYVSNNVPEVAVVQTRQDYYAEVWPKTTRAQFYGIYAQEVLAVYAPFGIALITNIGNGVS